MSVCSKLMAKQELDQLGYFKGGDNKMTDPKGGGERGTMPVNRDREKQGFVAGTRSTES